MLPESYKQLFAQDELRGNWAVIAIDNLTGPENGFSRKTHGFKPAADIDLGVSFAAEMAGGWAHGGS
ncbi:MAG: hypothetical protein WBD25_12080 [Terriglobales bacterium]